MSRNDNKIGKCELCGGPVVNGRCTRCGMPAFDEQSLYHVNEERQDHYQHASEKEKKRMDAQGMGPGGPDKGKSSASAGKNVWVEKERKQSRKKEKENRRNLAGREKKRGWRRFVFPALLVILVVCVGAILYQSYEENSADSRFFLEEGEYMGYLSPGQDLFVGDSVPAGDYVLFAPEGQVRISIVNWTGARLHSQSLTLDPDRPWDRMDLDEGQQVIFTGGSGAALRLEFYRMP